MKNWRRLATIIGALACVAVLAFAIQSGIDRQNPQPCGTPTNLSFFQKVFQMSPSPGTCGVDSATGSCLAPGTPCTKDSGRVGICANNNSGICTCQATPNKKGGKKKH